MNSVAVIGGSGFIGRNMVRELIRNGYIVRVVDRQPLNEEGVQFVECDILDQGSLNYALEGVDGVFHLAALVGVNDCLSNGDRVRSINLQGTANVINACKRNRISKLFFSSSSEIYGDGLKVPFLENDTSFPKSVYGKTKLESEYLLRDAASEDLVVRVVRFFNIYGPEQREDFVMKKFVKLALQNYPITIYGNGSQIRCFTHVRDAIAGSLLAYHFQGDPFEVFNIANSSRPTTVLELAQEIVAMLHSKSEIVFRPLDEQDSRPSTIEIFRRIPDTSKARELLNFSAQISLEQGIQDLASFITECTV